MTLLNYLKTIILLLIIIHIGPLFLHAIKQQYLHIIHPQTYVGSISFKGPITNAVHYQTQLHDFFKDPDIKAILLMIDSHESAAGTGESLFYEIQALKHEYKKPIIALIESSCYGGGYLIASATDHIIAPGTALIHATHITHIIGQQHDQSSAQKTIDTIQNQYREHIAHSRNLSAHESSMWVTTVLTGKQAFDSGLIDEIGSYHNALKALKDKALIEHDIILIETPEPQCLLHTMYHALCTVIHKVKAG